MLVSSSDFFYTELLENYTYFVEQIAHCFKKLYFVILIGGVYVSVLAIIL